MYFIGKRMRYISCWRWDRLDDDQEISMMVLSWLIYLGYFAQSVESPNFDYEDRGTVETLVRSVFFF